MRKPTFPKSQPSLTIIHPAVVSFYNSSLLKEDEYYRPISHAAKKQLFVSKIEKKSITGINLDFPHSWEMTDYDDDHFELLSFSVKDN
jgi:hypothetical protein